MKKITFGLLVGFILMLNSAFAVQTYSTLSISVGDDEKSEASFFDASSKKATIFVPGKIFHKESWHFLAKKLQDHQVASLCLDGKYPAYVTKAISILKEKGFTQINIIGGSMGAAAVLNALKNVDSSVKKVIVIAPFGGKPILNKSISKLFIVGKDDGIGFDTYDIFKKSNEKKQLKEFDSPAHAQHLFHTKHKEDLTKLIIRFISN